MWLGYRLGGDGVSEWSAGPEWSAMTLASSLGESGPRAWRLQQFGAATQARHPREQHRLVGVGDREQGTGVVTFRHCPQGLYMWFESLDPPGEVFVHCDDGRAG